MASLGEAGPMKKGRWEMGEDGVIRIILTDEEEKEKQDGIIQQEQLDENRER